MERNVFVTGADRGLGLALCAGLLRQSWHVFAGQYMPDWHELSALADKYPQALHIIPLDVSSMKSVQSAARAVGTLTEHLDVLINNAGVNSPTIRFRIREPQDYSEMHRLYDVNALGSLRMVEVFLPLMERGRLQTVVFRFFGGRQHWRGAKNELVQLLHVKSGVEHGSQDPLNDLHPAGYIFRVYHPGPVRSYMNTNATLEPEEAAARAIPILLGEREEEDRLAMVDYEGNEWPW